MEDQELSAPDVSTEPSSEAPAPSVEENHGEKPDVKEKYVPYDRFQEVINQKNEHARQFEEQRQRYAELEQRMNQFQESQKPKTPSKEQALIDRLKGIDPEFGSWAEQQEAAKQASQRQLEQMIQAQTQYQQQVALEQMRTQANSTLEQLHQQYKIPADQKDVRETIRQLIQSACITDPNAAKLTVQDLPRFYKEAHAKVEAYRRYIIGEYGKAKKQDASLPQNSRGPAPKSTKKPQTFSKDREEALNEVVSRAFKRQAQNAQ